MTGIIIEKFEITVVAGKSFDFVHFGWELDVGQSESISIQRVDHFDASVGHVDAAEVVADVSVGQVSGQQMQLDRSSIRLRRRISVWAVGRSRQQRRRFASRIVVDLAIAVVRIPEEPFTAVGTTPAAPVTAPTTASTPTPALPSSSIAAILGKDLGS